MSKIKKNYMTEKKIMVTNKELIERLKVVMKKDNKEPFMEWVLVDFKPPYETTDKWFMIDTKAKIKYEVSCAELLNLYNVLGENEITQKEYFERLLSLYNSSLKI